MAEWKPEPLVTQVDPDHEALHVPIIDHKVNKVQIRIPDIQIQCRSEYQTFKYSGDPNTGNSNTVEIRIPDFSVDPNTKHSNN